jgi:ATP-dependent DNA ligase
MFLVRPLTTPALVIAKARDPVFQKVVTNQPTARRASYFVSHSGTILNAANDKRKRLVLRLRSTPLCSPVKYRVVLVPKFQPLTLGRASGPFSHRDWLFELKFDGFRALVRIEQGKCRLVSRKGNDFKSFRKLNESLLADSVLLWWDYILDLWRPTATSSAEHCTV